MIARSRGLAQRQTEGDALAEYGNAVRHLWSLVQRRTGPDLRRKPTCASQRKMAVERPQGASKGCNVGPLVGLHYTSCLSFCDIK